MEKNAQIMVERSKNKKEIRRCWNANILFKNILAMI
jgi:hypothetical protein